MLWLRGGSCCSVSLKLDGALAWLRFGSAGSSAGSLLVGGVAGKVSLLVWWYSVLCESWFCSVSWLGAGLAVRWGWGFWPAAVCWGHHGGALRRVCFVWFFADHAVFPWSKGGSPCNPCGFARLVGVRLRRIGISVVVEPWRFCFQPVLPMVGPRRAPSA